jgi:hypothetical protein
MSEELGKIEKPSTEQFRKGRRLFFVPLVFAPPEPEGEFSDKIRSYWDQVEKQITGLEAKLGSVQKVFHELVPVGGEQGDSAIGELNTAGHAIVRSRVERGAEIQALEDIDVLTEFMDWSRCLAVGLQNPKVMNKVYESYAEVRSRRNEELAKRLDESLGEEEIGLLLLREGHQVQFPSDIEVFYVSPPALDDIKRWIRSREEEFEAAAREAAAGEGTETEQATEE